MRTSLRVGLVIAIVLGLADLALPFGADFIPMPVAIGAAALGLVTVACAVPAWRGSRGALGGVVAARVISAVLALPAFFVADVPASGLAAAGTETTLTLVVLALALPGLRRPRLA